MAARCRWINRDATRDYADEACREDTAIWAVVDPDEICDRSKK